MAGALLPNCAAVNEYLKNEEEILLLLRKVNCLWPDLD
jgi:hypothetical protein